MVLLNHILKRNVLIIILLAFALSGFAQVSGDYRSKATGAWGSSSTWQVFNGVSWVNASSYPGQNSDVGTVTIGSGNTVTLNVDITSYTIDELIIGDQSGGNDTLSIPNNGDFDVNIMSIAVQSDGILSWVKNADVHLPEGAIIYNNGGQITTDKNCNASQNIYIGANKFSNCNGNGGVDYSFEEIESAPPPPTSNGDISECEENPIQTLTASATPPSETHVVWYTTTSGGSPVAPTLNTVGNVTYYGESVDNSDSNRRSIFRTAVNLTILPRPSIAVSSSPSCDFTLSPTTYELEVTVSTGMVSSTAGTVTNTSGTVWAITNVPSGTNIVVTVSDANGCTNQLPVTAPDCTCPVPSITTQPVDQAICNGNNGSFTIVASGTTLDYQWQLSTNGGATFNDLSDGGVYAGTNSATLDITGAVSGMNNYQYQVIVGNSGFVCPDITSNAVVLTISDVSVGTVMKQLYLSDPSQALDRVDPVATGDLTTSQSIDLSTNCGVTGQASWNNRASGLSWSDTGAIGDPGPTPGSFVATYAKANHQLGIQTWDITTLAQNWFSGSVVNNGVAVWSPDGGGAREVHYDSRETTTGTPPVLRLTLDQAPFTIDLIASKDTWIFKETPDTNYGTCTSISADREDGGHLRRVLLAFDLTGISASASILSAQLRLNNTHDSGSMNIDVYKLGASDSWSEGTGTTANFTQAIPVCSPLTIKACEPITISNYISVTSGTMPVSPDITATLTYGATTFATLTNPTYNGVTGLLTWTQTPSSDITIPAGQFISLNVTTSETNASFRIDYDSQTKPSKIELPVSTYIEITSYDAYDAPYPGGSVITTAETGSLVYLRAVVTDPFGSSDITDLTMDVLGSPVTATSVATSGCTRTYEYEWDTTGSKGIFSLPSTAKEGYENTVTDVENLNITITLTVNSVITNRRITIRVNKN